MNDLVCLTSTPECVVSSWCVNRRTQPLTYVINTSVYHRTAITTKTEYCAVYFGCTAKPLWNYFSQTTVAEFPGRWSQNLSAIYNGVWSTGHLVCIWTYRARKVFVQRNKMIRRHIPSINVPRWSSLHAWKNNNELCSGLCFCSI